MLKGIPKIISPELIKILMEMGHGDEIVIGDANFPGMTVCAKTGTGELDKKASNAMFTGFVTDAQYPLAFIVCVEEGGYGRATCVPIASKVLAACKEVLDAQ